MLEETDPAVIAAFKARKLAQWEAVAGKLPGLQLVQSGPSGTQFMLVYSTDDHYEGVIIGQFGHIHIEQTGSSRNPVRRLAPNERKPADKQDIDISDSEIESILLVWSAGSSALTLPFVPFVYGCDGRRRS